MQALAADGGGQVSTSATVSQEPAASGQAAEESQSSSAVVAQEQGAQEPASDSGKAQQAAPAPTAAGESQANGTRGSPAEKLAAAHIPAPAAMKAPLRAPAAAKQVDASITRFDIQDWNHNTATQLDESSHFYLAMDWDASENGTDIHEGDYFDIALPDTMRFPDSSPAADFDLTDADGNVVATAHVAPGPGGDNHDAGGTVRVTFTKAAEGRYNVKGTMHLSAYFERSKVKTGEDNTFTVTVNGEVSGHGTSTSVGIIGTPDLPDEVLSKWGGEISGDKNQALWHVRINHDKSSLTSVVVADELQGGTETYVPGSFKLEKVDFDSKGNVTHVYETVDTSSMLTISPDGHSFKLNLGNVPGDQYNLEYASTYTPGSTLKNRLKLTSTEKSKTVESNYHSADSGGTAGGDLASKIKIVKVAADDQAIVLANAVFTVTRPDGSTFELTTGADGTVTSGHLEQGTYRVKEKTAPAGYELNGEEFALEVTPAGGAVKTVTDEPVKTSVSVTKRWVGPEGGPVTVHLLADGTDTGKTLVLTKDGGWTGSFDGLRKVAADGHEVAYTISEDPVTNYDSAVSGDAAAGFTITNTDTEKTSVPVTKKWVGPKGSEVTVKLLANGSDSGKELKLSDANGWKGEFAGLAKYKDDGSEIKYSVTESEVSGADGSKYATSVAGDAASGFTITNKNTETVDVSGTKTWNDDNDRDGVRPDSINVNLLADGTEVAEKTVTADDGWAYSFDRLPKYSADDGHEIKYTVTEDAVANYATAISGTSIANSYTPGKTSVTVSKAWADANDQDGMRPDSVKVQLYANGVASGDPVTLDADNGWTHTWTGLFMKDGGKDIVYAVQEVGVPAGYTAAITGDAASGFTVTNAHEPETVSVPVTKKWIGGEGGAVTIRLLADGADTGKTISLDKAGGWAGSFDGLPKFKDGNQISYTVAEDAVEGYTSEISGDAASGFTVTNTKDETPGTPGSPSQGKSGGAPSLLPKTGDDTVVPIALLAAALAAGAAGLAARRRMAAERDDSTAGRARHLKR